MMILYSKSYDNSMRIKCTTINKEKTDSVPWNAVDQTIILGLG